MIHSSSLDPRNRTPRISTTMGSKDSASKRPSLFPRMIHSSLVLTTPTTTRGWVSSHRISRLLNKNQNSTLEISTLQALEGSEALPVLEVMKRRRRWKTLESLLTHPLV